MMDRMNAALRRYCPAFGLGLIAALVSVPALAVSISQTPLFVSYSSAPNVLFVLDDSGSMQFESMPDELTNLFNRPCCGDYIMWMFPFVSGVHGGDSYSTRRVPSFSASSIMAAVYRSPHTNKLYYDPAVTYRPWSRADGSLMPAADPENAYHNPAFPGRGARDLTAVDSAYAEWMDDRDNDEDRESRQYHPATYFQYTGPEVDDVREAIEDGNSAVWNLNNYDRVVIRSSRQSYTGGGRSNRSDCNNGTCTYEQEIQNFANWYVYYRSRIFAARAGIGRAFSDQPDSLRVGFGAINAGERDVDGLDTDTVIRGIRPFKGSDREAFFETLYEQTIDPEGTPLRRGLQGAGEYFGRDDEGSPWADSPSAGAGGGPGDGGDNDFDFVCSFLPWLPRCQDDDDDDADDGDDGYQDPADHSPCRQSFTVLMTDGYWSGGSPDDIGNADNTAGPNIERPDGADYRYTPVDPFRDAHSDTLADVAMYYWQRDLRTDLDNTVPTSNRDPAFWQHMVTYGIGLGVTGNVDPDAAFAAIDTGADIDWDNPAYSDAAKIDDLLHAGLNSRGGFFSAANPEEFASDLSAGLDEMIERVITTAASLAATSTQASGETSVFRASFRTDDWSGELISYPYTAVGNESAIEWRASEQIPIPSQRDIYTADSGGDGVEFQWSQIDSDARQALGGDSRVLEYIRGSQTSEGTDSDDFRERNSVLGDIVYSAPAFVGDQSYGYSILPSAAGAAYAGYVNGKSSKRDAVLLGANDGMLHAFDAADGSELFGYVPRQLLAHLSELTEQDYSHRYYVDGSPAVADAYLNDAWHTVAVTTLGRGGRGAFALDVTDPTDFGADDILWEIDADDSGYLGDAMGQAAIVRLENGDWVAILGNGYNSSDGRAALVVVDLETGSVLKTLDTGVGDDNGLATPVAIDRDRNGSVDTVYAGDLKGNLWKFDLSGNTSARWHVAYGGDPLFRATADDGDGQPITARPDAIAHPLGGVMVVFGTGRYLAQDDMDQADEQSMYGIWDREGSAQPDTAASAGDLVEQETILMDTTVGDRTIRVLSRKGVNYSDEDGGRKRGWTFDFARDRERLTREVDIFDGKAIFVSTIPQADSCSFGGDSALFEINPLTGTQFEEPILDLNDDGEFDDEDSTTADFGDDAGDTRVYPGIVELDIGLATNPYILNKEDGNQSKLTIGSTLNTDVMGEKGFLRPGRASWQQIR